MLPIRCLLDIVLKIKLFSSIFILEITASGNYSANLSLKAKISTDSIFTTSPFVIKNKIKPKNANNLLKY